MSAPEHRAPWDARAAFLCIAGLLLTVPFVCVPTAAENFRAPKLWASDLWGLASLVFLAVALRRVERLTLADVWRSPALRLALPLLALALLSRFTTAYPLGVARASAELAIGGACLVGWSTGLRQMERDRLLALLAWPAVLLSILAVLQVTHLYRPFDLPAAAEASRLGVVSLAGNPCDLAMYLVLPGLLLQASLLESRGGRRLWVGAVLGLTIAGLAATQTFTALAALTAGSALFWLQRLPRRRALIAMAVAVGLALAVVFAVPPLRERTFSKARALKDGDLGEVLTYRLDGWRAATWMLEQHPLAGVGHGAYRSSYAAARLALAAQGADYSGRYRQLAFFNAHNDALELAAELGWPGVLVLGFALWTLVQCVRRAPASRRPLAVAGVASLALLALAGFPFETALVVYPWLLFLSGVLDPMVPVEARSAVAPPSVPVRKRRRRR